MVSNSVLTIYECHTLANLLTHVVVAGNVPQLMRNSVTKYVIV